MSALDLERRLEWRLFDQLPRELREAIANANAVYRASHLHMLHARGLSWPEILTILQERERNER